MSATALDVPAVNSSVPASVGTTNASVTSSERSESIDKVILDEWDGNVAGAASTDTDGDAVMPGYVVGLIDNITPAECNVDDDNDDEDNDDEDSDDDEA